MSLQITYRQGGMDEFKRTGIYPIKLLVYDPNFKKRWWRKISDEKNSGELKIENEIIYKYHVDIDSNEISIFHHNGALIDNCSIINEMWD
jgi:hypothetical protein